MVAYYDLGPEARLNQIVIAGSHDAGITQGGANARTQEYDIGQQARYGVRLFDIRIAGARTTSGGKSVEAARAYHGSPSEKKVKRDVVGLEGERKVVRSYMKAGTWGERLPKILSDAREFVESGAGQDEFLILKFDKCINWDLIAESCVEHLGTALYTEGGNVNLRRLRHLRGKVIVVFTAKGLAAAGEYRSHPGILGIKNLLPKDGVTPAYDPEYRGIQYYGKGGTNPFSPGNDRAVNANEEKQRGLMRDGAAGNHNVMGMMYWTSTGVASSIEDRNASMWDRAGRTALRNLWCEGLGASILNRLPRHMDGCHYSHAGLMKVFMPNIIMVDFADAEKCRQIKKLNTVAANQLTREAINQNHYNKKGRRK